MSRIDDAGIGIGKIQVSSALELINPENAGARSALLAFNGKRSGKVFLKHHFGGSQIDYGLQHRTVGNTRIFVLPSTSGAANGFWDEEPWYALAHHAKTV